MEFSGVNYEVIVKGPDVFVNLTKLIEYFEVSGLDAKVLRGLDGYIRFDVEVQRLLEAE